MTDLRNKPDLPNNITNQIADQIADQKADHIINQPADQIDIVTTVDHTLMIRHIADLDQETISSD